MGKLDMDDRSPELVASVREKLAQQITSHSSRKEKSLAAARILFFDCSVHPSAKLVLECTQHGSLTDINRDVHEFWRELREKAKLRINAPELPQHLVDGFGDTLRQIWEMCSAAAQEAASEVRLRAIESVSKADARAEQAIQERRLAQEQVSEAVAELRKERDRREEAVTAASLLQAEIENLKAEGQKLTDRVQAEINARAEAEKRFTSELEAVRQERLREADRFKGEINFAKQQIEAARMSEKTAREQFAATKSGMEVELTHYRTRLGSADASLAQAMAELGEAKGLNRALAKSVEDLQERLRFMTMDAAKRSVSSKAPLKRRSLR